MPLRFLVVLLNCRFYGIRIWRIQSSRLVSVISTTGVPGVSGKFSKVFLMKKEMFAAVG